MLFLKVLAKRIIERRLISWIFFNELKNFAHLVLKLTARFAKLVAKFAKYKSKIFIAVTKTKGLSGFSRTTLFILQNQSNAISTRANCIGLIKKMFFHNFSVFGFIHTKFSFYVSAAILGCNIMCVTKSKMIAADNCWFCYD